MLIKNPSRSKAFTVSGTLVVPPGIGVVYVTAVGGGGGGGGGQTGLTGAGGGGGGAGSGIVRLPFPVAAGGSYTVVVGAAGTGSALDTDGVDGGACQFNSDQIAFG